MSEPELRFVFHTYASRSHQAGGMDARSTSGLYVRLTDQTEKRPDDPKRSEFIDSLLAKKYAKVGDA